MNSTQMKNYIIKIVPWIICVIFLSCSGSGTNENVTLIPIKEIKEKVNKNASIIQTLEASGTIAFETPEESNSGSFELIISKPDSLLLKIEGPFGIDIANILITRNNFIYYDVQNNKVITGPTTDINLGAILRIKLNFDELINSFTASFSFSEDSTDNIEGKVDNGLYLLEPTSKDLRRKYFIEPIKFLIQKYYITNIKNVQVLEVNYNKYDSETINGSEYYFPSEVMVKKPEKKQTVWLYYSSKNINKHNLNFKFKIPKSAKYIEW